jgi:hypothetical protein
VFDLAARRRRLGLARDGHAAHAQAAQFPVVSVVLDPPLMYSVTIYVIASGPSRWLTR